MTLSNLKVRLQNCIVKSTTDLADTAAKTLLVAAAEDNCSFLEACLSCSLSNNFIEREFLAGLKDRTVDLLACLGEVSVTVCVVGCLCCVLAAETEVCLELLSCDLRFLLNGRDYDRTCVFRVVKELLDLLDSSIDIDRHACFFRSDSEFLG